MLQNKSHAERKRMLASMYSKSYIRNSPDLAYIFEAILLNRLVPRIDAQALTGALVDILGEAKACFMDLITAYLFGIDAGTDFIRDDETRDYYFRAFVERSAGFFWRAELLDIKKGLFSLGKKFGFRVPQSANEITEAWCYRLCMEARKMSRSKVELGLDSRSEFKLKPNVYTHLRRALEADGIFGERLDTELAAEMLDHIIATFDASGITVTYLLYELSKRQLLRRRLRSELHTLSNGFCSPSAVSEIDRLPLLDAILMETLRLYAVSPGPKPRCVPAGGCRLGHFVDIPGGTVVSASSYSLHRNSDVFYSPEKWRPERWLQASAESRAEMKRWFSTFGNGSRACIGEHFAMRSEF